MTAAARFTSASDRPMLTEELAREGLAQVSFDGATIRDGAELLDALARALTFPDYYGRNWDAAEECLRDLGERYPQGAALLVEGAGALWQRLPRELGLLTSIWLAASETAGAPLRLIYVLEKP